MNSFSIVDGGPLYQLLRWLRLEAQAPAVLVRRIAWLLVVTWLPLLVLSYLSGRAYGSQVQIPFLYDLSIYGKLLLALPLLVLAEFVVDSAVGRATDHLRDSGIVPADQQPGFDAILERARQQRDAFLPETLLFVLAGFPMFLLNRDWMLENHSHWHSTVSGPTAAGWWFALVSSPIFRFLMYRWVWKFVIWSGFLFRISRLKLHLVATHPDFSAGLGFLAAPQRRFGILFCAFGCVFAGQMANQIAYAGAHLIEFRALMVAFIVMSVVIDLAPLALLAPTLIAVKKAGLLSYGALGNQYTQAFERKWVQGKNPSGEQLLGSADIQSLADLTNSFSVVKEMRVAPITKLLVIQIAVQAALPMVPVILFATPAEEIINRVLKMLL